MAPLPPLQIVRLCDAHLVRGETFSYLDGKPLADSFLAMLADAEHLARALVMVRRPAETVAITYVGMEDAARSFQRYWSHFMGAHGGHESGAGNSNLAQIARFTSKVKGSRLLTPFRS